APFRGGGLDAGLWQGLRVGGAGRGGVCAPPAPARVRRCGEATGGARVSWSRTPARRRGPGAGGARSPWCHGRAAGAGEPGRTPSVTGKLRSRKPYRTERATAGGPMRWSAIVGGAGVACAKVTKWFHGLVENDTKAYLHCYDATG